jgi:hypothetical protein
VSDLTDLLKRRRSPTPTELIRVLAQIADRLERYEQLFDIVQENAVRMTLVATVADLPANAPPRQLFRVTSGTVAERTAIYVGNGPSQPLSKLVPVAL